MYKIYFIRGRSSCAQSAVQERCMAGRSAYSACARSRAEDGEDALGPYGPPTAGNEELI